LNVIGASGIGVDVVSVPSFERTLSLGGAHFAHRIFSAKEEAWIVGRVEVSASVFALKEAIMKALGGGMTMIDWLEIEFESLDRSPTLHGDARVLAEQQGVTSLAVSVGMSGTFVIATALAYQQQAGMKGIERRRRDR
jgi:phosphopantetheine--protein transferase-like protein